MKVLTGREVFSQVLVDSAVQSTRASADGTVPSRPYYRARHDGKGFTVDQAFMDAYSKGEIIEISLSEGKYNIPDPKNVGQFLTRESWTLSGFATKTQIKSLTSFEKEIDDIKNPALNAVVLDDVKIKKLQESALG